MKSNRYPNCDPACKSTPQFPGSKYATAQIMPTPVCFFAWCKTCEATNLKREEKDGTDGSEVLAEGVAPGQRTRLRRNYGTIFTVLCIPPSTSDHSANSVILRPSPGLRSPLAYRTCLTRRILSNLIQRKAMVLCVCKEFCVRNLTDTKIYMTLRYHYSVPSCFTQGNPRPKKRSRKGKGENKQRRWSRNGFHERRALCKGTSRIVVGEGREAARTFACLRPALKDQIIEAQPRNLSIQAFKGLPIDIARRESPGFNKRFFCAESNPACLSSKSMA